MTRLLDYAEPAAHVAIIGAALVLSWMYWPSGRFWTANTGPTVHVDSSEVLRRWRPTERRVFLFVSPTCPYCRRSMDFYARLGRMTDSLRRAGTPVSMAAVISRSVSPRAQRELFRNSKVPVDTLLVLSSRSLSPVGVTSVPTVAIEKLSGADPSTWVGLQDSTGEQEIVSAVRQFGGMKDRSSK